MDPVLVSTSGHALAEDSVAKALLRHLTPLAALITPNIPEASALLGERLQDRGSPHLVVQRGGAGREGRRVRQGGRGMEGEIGGERGWGRVPVHQDLQFALCSRTCSYAKRGSRGARVARVCHSVPPSAAVHA